MSKLVRLRGIQSDPLLNNRIATLKDFNDENEKASFEEKNRTCVILRENKRELSLKRENVVSIEDENLLKQYSTTSNPIDAFIGTVCIFLEELKFHNILPDISTDNKLSLLFIGASDKYENDSSQCDFPLLFDRIYNSYYPFMEKLEIVLCGNELSPMSTKKFHHDKVLQTNYNKLLEVKYGSSLPNFSLAFILQPGFTSFLDIWKPAISLLLDKNIPCLCGGYSLIDKVTDDGLFDEDAIKRYYGGRIISSRSYNPKYYQFGPKPHQVRNAIIFIFQGRNNDENFTAMPRNEYRKDMFARYLHFQGDYYGNQHPQFKMQCIKLANQLLNGTIPITNSFNLKVLLQMANDY